MAIFDKFPGPGVNVILFTASGAYTPSPGVRYITVEAVGGGGGVSGLANSPANSVRMGAAGGSGALIRAMLTAAQLGTAPIPITIGAGGAAASNGLAAGAGGATTFGAFLSAGGGAGGDAGTGVVNAAAALPAAGGIYSIAVGTDIGSMNGSPSRLAWGVVSGTRVLLCQPDFTWPPDRFTADTIVAVPTGASTVRNGGNAPANSGASGQPTIVYTTAATGGGIGNTGGSGYLRIIEHF